MCVTFQIILKSFGFQSLLTYGAEITLQLLYQGLPNNSTGCTHGDTSM